MTCTTDRRTRNLADPAALSALALLADRADELADAARVAADLNCRLHLHELAVTAGADAGGQR